MHTVLRLPLAAVLASLAAAPSAFADTATRELFIARDACGGTTPANLRLSASTGAFTGNCGSLLGGLGGSNQAYATPKNDPGLPVVLEPSRPIQVAVAVSSDPGLLVGGLGAETVELSLSGKRGSQTVALGSASQTTPADVMLTRTDNVYEFALPLAADKAGTYSSITLTLRVGGSQQSGYVDHGGGTYVSLPVTDASVPD